jgi:hypothetical protein
MEAARGVLFGRTGGRYESFCKRAAVGCGWAAQDSDEFVFVRERGGGGA